MFESTRVLLLLALSLGVGVTLLLSELRWFRRPRLATRLAPYAGKRNVAQPASSFLEALSPVAELLGGRISNLFGVKDDLSTRLRRAHLSTTVSQFRLRQLLWASAALIVATLLAVAMRPPALLTVLVIAGLPLLVFLLIEQQVVAQANARSQRIFSELPVMSEQLAMLLGAGFSLGSAINQLATRGGGVISEDLALVRDRTLHGIPIAASLREWSDVARVDEVTRLVAVLALGSETSDLGRLVSDEAKSIRREAQRRLAETIDRRSQQVWIPVTVATLIPGVIFLTIPFLQALQLFSAS